MQVNVNGSLKQDCLGSIILPTSEFLDQFLGREGIEAFAFLRFLYTECTDQHIGIREA
jgi:hypothetical protein